MSLCTWCGEADAGVHAKCAAEKEAAEYRKHEDKAERRRLAMKLEREARRFGSESIAHLAAQVRRSA